MRVVCGVPELRCQTSDVRYFAYGYNSLNNPSRSRELFLLFELRFPKYMTQESAVV